MDSDGPRPAAAPWQPRRQWRYLVAIALIKLGLLYGAYQLWFAQPLAHHMRVDLPVVEDHLIGRPADPLSSHPPQGVNHDPRRPAG